MRPKLAWLVAVGLVVGLAVRWNGASPGQAQANPPSLGGGSQKSAAAGTGPACYTWDFLNNSGLDASGLVIHLKGIPILTDVYNGVLNPFGAPDPASGYDPGTDMYSLIFSGGSVPDSGMAQIGICASQPALRLDSALPAFYWVASGTPVSPAPLFAGLDFNWIDSNHLQVHLYNEQAAPLTLFSFSVLTPPGQLALDDLNDGVASSLPVASDQVGDPLDLAGGTGATFDIYLDQGNVQAAFGAPLVVEAVLSAQDDPSNAMHLLAQTAQPFARVFLPVTKK